MAQPVELALGVGHVIADLAESQHCDVVGPDIPDPHCLVLDFLHEITRQYGIVLIFDEVIAFRLGQAGAQGRYGGKPDLTTFGKIIGGGLPIGAVGGRADIMALLDPAGGSSRVISGGTYSGNPL